MKALDLVASAAANTFRSKVRTALTVLAIIVGAFTLTLTNGLGTGINSYIDDTVSSIGAEDVLTVTKAGGSDSPVATDGPVEYDPDAVDITQAGPPGASVVAMRDADIEALAAIDGVADVEPVRAVSADFIRAGRDGTPYIAAVTSLVPGQELQLAAGAAPDGSQDPQLVIPADYVSAMGFADAEDAIGGTATIGLTDAVRTEHLVDARITGVAEAGLTTPAGGVVTTNAALAEVLVTAQSTGLPPEEADRFAQATVRVDDVADIAAVQDRLEDAGFTGATVADQLGLFRTVVDAIILVLNAFGVIALLAAGFGIVNTLYMSVQERTREIGLMKAMGMGSGRVFALFSLEATFIGLLGSALGAGLAILVGTGISGALSGSVLADLPGLTILAFDPLTVLLTIVAVMLIAFLAGTLPAARAARADPVTSLRYE